MVVWYHSTRETCGMSNDHMLEGPCYENEAHTTKHMNYIARLCESTINYGVNSSKLWMQLFHELYIFMVLLNFNKERSGL